MDTNRIRRRIYCVWAAVTFLCCSSLVLAAAAGVPVHIVRTDLKSLIRAAADSPVQFAVLVPHKASTASAGTWSTADGRATWQYAVEIPTAVSMSFHATHSSLPAGATLIVKGAKTTVSYRARDLHRGELWSRIQPGEALEFTLTVPIAVRGEVVLQIVSLQAGYRAIGSGVEDHPYYRQLKAQTAAATGNAACVTNYECEVTTANTPPGAATMGLIVANQWICTGVLINDVPGDNAPYVLTARHCETGKGGGGNPGAASTVNVYWDATTPCGSSLGSFYDPGIPVQTGATTVVEQQDAWLIELDTNPVVSDAQFAGFDASGGAVQGGYTIHHAEGYDKQFTEWYGSAYGVQANDVLGTSYVSNFWETVNQLGNVAPGASGSGLFDQNNHLVGSLTLGRITNDPSGYGACPVTPLTAPNGTNGVADFTALAWVWNSTADTTSSTGSTTIKTVLDPGNTGTEVVSSAPVAVVTFDATTEALSDGQPDMLTWSAPNATQCTASGGVSGDGWSGTLAASGSKSVTESSAGFVTYTLTCAYAGSRTAKASVIVSWLGPTPIVTLTAASTTVWITTPATLSWTSNVAPCAITGGSLSLTNLAATGSTTTTQSTASDVNYTLTCGPSNQATSAVLTVAYVTPSLVLIANGTDRLLGQTFFLLWSTAASSCTPSGGAPNDGWAATQFAGDYGTGEPYYPNVTTLGTYTYTLTCTSGSLSETQSVTVTFENNAPYVTTSLSSSSVTFSDSPADYVTLSWNSNLSGCGFSSTPSIPIVPAADDGYPQASMTITPYQSGSYQLVIYCSTALNPESIAASATPLTLTVLPPPPPAPKISFSPSTVVAGENFNVSWSSANSSDCTMTGGIPGGLWGQQGAPMQGSDSENGPAGTYTFGLTCSSIDPSSPPVATKATLTIGPLTASLSASASSVTEGDSFTLSWSSVGATGCAATGGGANGNPWSGELATSGSATQTATVSGTFTYTLTCVAGNAATAPQNVSIKVAAASSSGAGSSSSSSGGGGGGLGMLELGSLVMLLGLRQIRRPRAGAASRAAASA